MKRILIPLLASCLASAHAAIVTFALSPAGTDNAAGMSPLNETPPVLNSSGSGNEIGSGIRFNTDTFTLSLSIGYGSAFGFSNLTGPATAAHIHGPAPTNTPASVVISLAGLNIAATNPATGGSIVGDVPLTVLQSSNLMAGLYYINVHTATNPAGEIRGQLVPVNTVPTVVCPASTNVECTGTNGTFVSVIAQVADLDGDALTIVWSVDGAVMQTNTVGTGLSSNLTSVTFPAILQNGSYNVGISVSDGINTATCNATVAVIDTIAPVIHNASVMPNILWPPNHQMIPVQATVVAEDLCSPVTTCRIKSITSNQAPNAKGSGNTTPDWQITGDLTANLRAERSGNGKNGRIYTLVIECTDASGNSSRTNLTVLVPHDQGKGRGNDGSNGSNGNGGNSTNAPGHSGNLPPNSNGHGRGHAP